ncbi:MAG: type I restriction-modification enzyme R subunit C-terminal domain-containing protein [Bacteroidota bacterium]
MVNYAANEPEQKARRQIDKMLESAGWDVQDRDEIDFSTSSGIAVREYPTESGPADYVLFIDGPNPAAIIEAKRKEQGQNLSVVEEQAEKYVKSHLKHVGHQEIPFIYISNGIITKFTDLRESTPRAREIFSFPKPETLSQFIKQGKPLRERLKKLPGLPEKDLYGCQVNAIENLEKSFKNGKPRALVQMATGSGKTFTAITSTYRLLKYADAQRILFLVDTRNLGEQAEMEFMRYKPNDENRKFTELYNIQRLSSGYISRDTQVCISTIQRLYSILKGRELDETAEETHPAEISENTGAAEPVVYNPGVPPEFFDFIIIDECHRSIYNLWKQVLDYFDAFLIGLTATPDKRTFGFFHENVVSEYKHENAVTDGVNVPYEVYTIETKITKQGAKLQAKEYVDKRNRLTRSKRWTQLDEDVEYSSKQLDKKVVNPNQIRKIIRTFKDKLGEIFPSRREVPKTLIFAKTDSHADDIINIVREEFNEGNDFCKKVTYHSEENPRSILQQFRNEYNPRIAVTVDMIATGTDVKPIECLLFMRDVKSRGYFEQMKGRGTRILNYDDLKKVSPSVNTAKTHFVIVDAIGVTKSLKTDSRPLERKKSASMKDLLQSVLMGAGRDEDTMTSLANRLIKLDKKINDEDREEIKSHSGGKDLNQISKRLLEAFDPDTIEERATKTTKNTSDMSDEDKQKAQKELIDEAAGTFNGKLNKCLTDTKEKYDQIIDNVNIDKLENAGWTKEASMNAKQTIEDFKSYLHEHKDELTALRIFYDQPYRRREVTYSMINDVLKKLKKDKPALAPMRVWNAFEQLEEIKGQNPANDLTALVALIRRVTGIDDKLTSYHETVNKNFKDWIFKTHSGSGAKFNDEQMEWLRMIRDHVATSIHFDTEDLNYSPFDKYGGIGKMYKLFGNKMNDVIEEMNEELVA